ncbi:hypothetical protein EWU23_08575 [Cytophagaceae bacterium 50C-KIRBA]|uniref:Uncharacterized protein n=2 Tax=Aquirufa beregesia TaxID=2516556 RepID=A0ABX0EWM5_9BACT|nr:hypothetical protein [Aquirufa beregesia]
MINLAIFLYFSDSTSPAKKLVLPSPIPKLKINKKYQGVDLFNPAFQQTGYLEIDKKSAKTKVYERKRLNGRSFHR